MRSFTNNLLYLIDDLSCVYDDSNKDYYAIRSGRAHLLYGWRVAFRIISSGGPIESQFDVAVTISSFDSCHNNRNPHRNG